MKLLFDENLSQRLSVLLQQQFPGSCHVRDLGLRGASDTAIWDFAREHGFAIVSKDTDFLDRAMVAPTPPQVVWLSVGNAGTQAIRELLEQHAATLAAFDGDPGSSLLVLKRLSS